MTVPDPTYITADEVKEQTSLAALKNLLDADIDLLIRTAEDQIDSYVGPQEHHPYDTNIVRVFPRQQDFQIIGTASGQARYPDRPEIPYKVSVACLRQVEWLYTQWWPNKATAQIPVERVVESESIGGDGSYDATYARGGVSFAESSICEQAKTLLNGFVNRFTGLSTTNPDDVLPNL